MPVEPANGKIRQAVIDILSRFLVDPDRNDERLDPIRSEVYQAFQFRPLDANGLSSVLLRSADVGMRDDNLFLNLELVERQTILPFVTLHSCKEWRHFRVYALLTALGSGTGIQSFAIRFETDEGASNSGGGTGSHDFCHAQLCSGINKHVREVSRSWVPESQPSIPLDTDNQIGLVLCMLTSLYGGKHVRSKFNRSGDNWLRAHLNKIRALKDT